MVLVCCLATVPLAQAEVVLLRGATIHTVSGELIPQGMLTLNTDSGQIVALGPAGSVSTQGVDRTLDVTGKTITPGLIDADTSLGLVEIDAVSESRDTMNGPGPMHAAYRAADAFNPRSAILPVQRTGGVTGAVIAPYEGVFGGQGAYLELGAPGQSGRHATLIAPTLAHYLRLGPQAAALLQGSRATVLGYVRTIWDDLTFFLKNQARFDQNASRPLGASRTDLLALGTLLDGQKPLVARVSRASDIEAALEFAKSRGLRLVIEGGQEAWMVADALAMAGVPVILNPMNNLPADFSSLGSRSDNAALLHKAGVLVVIATGDAHNVRNLRQLAGNAVRAGLPYAQALHAITLAPAKAFGLEGSVGALAPGKRANLVVWSGDPLEISSKVEHLFVAGLEMPLTHRQHQLFERYRTLERRGTPAPQTP